MTDREKIAVENTVKTVVDLLTKEGSARPSDLKKICRRKMSDDFRDEVTYQTAVRLIQYGFRDALPEEVEPALREFVDHCRELIAGGRG